jgi:hypothetical protein
MSQEFEAGRVFAARLLSSQIRNVTIAAESLAGFADVLHACSGHSFHQVGQYIVESLRTDVCIRFLRGGCKFKLDISQW